MICPSTTARVTQTQEYDLLIGLRDGKLLKLSWNSQRAQFNDVRKVTENKRTDLANNILEYGCGAC